MNLPVPFPEKKRILLTGATGYVGGRLRRFLEERGFFLRCLARNPDHLKGRVAPRTEVVEGDLLVPESLAEALEGIDVAFYLVHSMGTSGDFQREERRGARNFASAALEAGVEKIVYLGALGRDLNLSSHLSSRQEVGRILRESGVPTIELRASIIIGSGSLSFEMIRSLVDRLPVMVTPKWVRAEAQPIAIEDVLLYLSESIALEAGESRIFEIGGPDQVSYEGLMKEYARQRGMRRWIIPVPVLTPRLSALWLGLVTPVFARIGSKLLEGVKNATVVVDQSAMEAYSISPRGISQAIREALGNEDRKFAETRWSDALSSGGCTTGYGGERFGSRIIDSHVVETDLSPGQLFRPVQEVGGERGWYFGNWLWQLRGFMDLLVGGVGVRRGRRHPVEIAPGDAIDFWRVESFSPDRLLRLRAEMKVPGRAWLQFEVNQSGKGSELRQTAIFDPLGLWGKAYWYALYPIHQLVFRAMLRGIVRSARETIQRAAGDDPGTGA